jgi:hypothetical protein
VIGVAAFPNVHLAFEAMREIAFDVLNRLLQGDVRGRCEDQMDVIWHNDEGVKRKSIFCTLLIQNFDE